MSYFINIDKLKENKTQILTEEINAPQVFIDYFTQRDTIDNPKAMGEIYITNEDSQNVSKLTPYILFNLMLNHKVLGLSIEKIKLALEPLADSYGSSVGLKYPVYADTTKEDNFSLIKWFYPEHNCTEYLYLDRFSGEVFSQSKYRTTLPADSTDPRGNTVVTITYLDSNDSEQTEDYYYNRIDLQEVLEKTRELNHYVFIPLVETTGDKPNERLIRYLEFKFNLVIGGKEDTSPVLSDMKNTKAVRYSPPAFEFIKTGEHRLKIKACENNFLYKGEMILDVISIPDTSYQNEVPEQFNQNKYIKALKAEYQQYPDRYSDTTPGDFPYYEYCVGDSSSGYGQYNYKRIICPNGIATGEELVESHLEIIGLHHSSQKFSSVKASVTRMRFKNVSIADNAFKGMGLLKVIDIDYENPNDSTRRYIGEGAFALDNYINKTLYVNRLDKSFTEIKTRAFENRDIFIILSSPEITLGDNWCHGVKFRKVNSLTKEVNYNLLEKQVRQTTRDGTEINPNDPKLVRFDYVRVKGDTTYSEDCAIAMTNMSEIKNLVKNMVELNALDGFNDLSLVGYINQLDDNTDYSTSIDDPTFYDEALDYCENYFKTNIDSSYIVKYHLSVFYLFILSKTRLLDDKLRDYSIRYYDLDPKVLYQFKNIPIGSIYKAIGI